MNPFCSIDGCNNFSFINGLCYSHDKEKKREEKAKLNVKKVYVIPKRSDKKKKADSEYTKLRKEFLQEYPLCQCSLNGPCNQKSETIHHTSLSAKNYLNTETWMALSLEHHIIIENLGAEFRRSKGLLKD